MLCVCVCKGEKDEKRVREKREIMRTEMEGRQGVERDRRGEKEGREERKRKRALKF